MDFTDPNLWPSGLVVAFLLFQLSKVFLAAFQQHEESEDKETDREVVQSKERLTLIESLSASSVAIRETSEILILLKEEYREQKEAIVRVEGAVAENVEATENVERAVNTLQKTVEGLINGKEIISKKKRVTKSNQIHKESEVNDITKGVK